MFTSHQLEVVQVAIKVCSINHLLPLDDCIIAGNINAHHSIWYSNLDADQRGEDFADES